MRSFHISSMTSEFLLYFFWISIDNFDAYAFQLTSFSFLNNLDVIPVFSWPRKCWRRSSPTVLWYFSPGLQHCFPICSFSISDESWWTCIWCIPFYLLHQILRHFFFRFLYGTSNPQTCLRVYHCSTPKGSSCIFFQPPPFSPL